jgi:hypothetical protein
VQALAVLGELIPDVLVRFCAMAEARAMIGGIESTKVVQLHRDTRGISESARIGAKDVKRQGVQHLAELDYLGVGGIADLWRLAEIQVQSQYQLIS